MDSIEFGQLVDEWAVRVKAMALVLFNAGVPAERVLPLAIQASDAKGLADAQREKDTRPKLFAPRPS